MQSFSRHSSLRALMLVLAISTPARRATAQADGFAVERFQPAAPGSGWLTADDLELEGGLGGGVALTFDYARMPLRVDMPDAASALGVVSNQATAVVALAVMYDRYRLTAALPSPLFLSGESGTAGGYGYTAPDVTLSHTPDAVSDPRIAFDVRIAGQTGQLFRLGAGAQLFVPSGQRRNYLTDDTFRGALRALVAGDRGMFRYAASIGVHIRPLDDAPVPETPRGSELVFGAAAGIRVPQGIRHVLFIGPEVFGSSAFTSFLQKEGSALEALLGATLQKAIGDNAALFVKLGAGGGLVTHLGAPEWRIVGSIAVVGCLPVDRRREETAP